MGPGDFPQFFFHVGEIGEIYGFLAFQVGLEDAVRAAVGAAGVEVEVIVTAGDHVGCAGAVFDELAVVFGICDSILFCHRILSGGKLSIINDQLSIVN
jgi:hypothetical protein